MNLILFTKSDTEIVVCNPTNICVIRITIDGNRIKIYHKIFSVVGYFRLEKPDFHNRR
jgi:hypothetical protein